MPDSRPRIFFNEEGVCNACENATIKKEKSSTSDLIERHPFIQTLKDIQNRAN